MKLIGQDNQGLGGDSMVSSIHWYCPQGHISSNSNIYARVGEQLPNTLVITFENGKMILSRGEDESSAELIDTDLTNITFARWSTKGNILALVGTQKMNNNNDRLQSTKGGESKSSSSFKSFSNRPLSIIIKRPRLRASIK
jgi:hypothetical protein